MVETNDSYWLLYSDLLDQVTLGAFHRVSEKLSEMRKNESDRALENIRRLISARIAIRKGASADELTWLEALTSDSSWFGAEAQFVLGLNDFHAERFFEGRQRFEIAKEKFMEMRRIDRAALAEYNAFIGRVREGALAGAAEQIAELSLIANRLSGQDDLGSKRVLAMVRRQKAHAYEDEGHLNASLKEIIAAIRIFADTGPVSDHHLALLHAADLCLDLDNKRRARIFLEHVIEPVENRVMFPLAFIKWRLGGDMPVLSSFSTLPPGWKEKFERLSRSTEADETKPPPRFIWEIENGVVRWEADDAPGLLFRAESLEGKLVRLLAQSKMSKHLLIEALWPEHVSVHHIDNRLHRLIGRINKKFGVKLVVFDGNFYRLNLDVQIK
jgi:tetratricopeptide (TPR) repeat protein